jgi:hypothetical protein
MPKTHVDFTLKSEDITDKHWDVTQRANRGWRSSESDGQDVLHGDIMAALEKQGLDGHEYFSSHATRWDRYRRKDIIWLSSRRMKSIAAAGSI